MKVIAHYFRTENRAQNRAHRPMARLEIARSRTSQKAESVAGGCQAYRCTIIRSPGPGALRQSRWLLDLTLISVLVVANLKTVVAATEDPACMEEFKRYYPIDRSNCEAAANCNVAPIQAILAVARLNGSKH